MKSTPWAILLCKFSEGGAEPYPRARFDEIFTSAGNGKSNMVDYFRDISHGSVDLNGSQVFPPGDGWYSIPHSRTEYLAAVVKDQQGTRNALLGWGRAAAAQNGDELGGFFNVVVITVPNADLFGGLGGAAADDGRNRDNGMTSLSPSLLGQEMGHGYGLAHARITGSTADYMDPFDIMSTAGAYMANHPVYTERDVRGNPIFLLGPGLTAAAMSALGWLDVTRVWTAGTNRSISTLVLRPLHRRDLPGFLCARTGNLFVEFRMNELWDAGFSDPVVLIHDYFDGHSYLHPADSGGDGRLVAGDSYSEGDVGSQPGPLHAAGTRITVTAIDPGARTATVTVETWPDQRPSAGPGSIFGAADRDGGGWIFINGTFHVVPPRSPLLPILQQLAQAQIAETVDSPPARDGIRQQAYTAAAELAAGQAARAGALHTPAPPLARRG